MIGSGWLLGLASASLHQGLDVFEVDVDEARDVDDVADAARGVLQHTSSPITSGSFSYSTTIRRSAELSGSRRLSARALLGALLPQGARRAPSDPFARVEPPEELPADLVASFHRCKQDLVPGGEDHGHAGHAQVMDLAMLDRDLVGLRVCV